MEEMIETRKVYIQKSDDDISFGTFDHVSQNIKKNIQREIHTQS